MISIRQALAVAVLAVAVAAGAAPAAIAAPPPAPTFATNDDGLYLSPVYSAAADPEADLARGLQIARAANKRVLIEVGGDWCVWCHILDAYLNTDKKARAAFLKSFVIVRVNWSPEHKNEAFLRRFPPRAGYPHLYVLDANGQVLVSQDTGRLEKGDSYDRSKMLKFAKTWLP